MSNSIDSYITKKYLLEFKLYSIRIKDCRDILSKFQTDEIKVRIRVWSGDVFWASTQFVKVKIKDSALSCDIKQYIKIKICPEISDYITVSLGAISAENDILDESLKSLKKEISIGYTKIDVMQIYKYNE